MMRYLLDFREFYSLLVLDSVILLLIFDRSDASLIEGICDCLIVKDPLDLFLLKCSLLSILGAAKELILFLLLLTVSLVKFCVTCSALKIRFNCLPKPVTFDEVGVPDFTNRVILLIDVHLNRGYFILFLFRFLITFVIDFLVFGIHAINKLLDVFIGMWNALCKF